MPRSSESPKSATKTAKQPPRPPNAWILFRSDMSKSMPPVRPGEPRPAQALVSKAISKMWQEASTEVKAEYERRAEAAKLQHMIKFPEYRFAPMKKEEKIRIREEKKREKEIQRDQSRRGRARPGAPFPYPLTLNTPATTTLPEHLYGSYGPSPPISAASSPIDTTSLADNASDPEPAASNATSMASNWPGITPEQHFSSQLSSESTPWPDSQSHSSEQVNGEMLFFDMLQGPAWNQPLEFEDQIHGFVTQTGNPSIFGIEFQSENMTNHPEGELNISWAPSDATQPDIPQFNFDNMFPMPTMDPTSSHTVLPLDIENLLASAQMNTLYNADDFINFEPALNDATPAVASPLTPSVSAPPPASHPITPPSSTSKAYVPPAGAARASIRRAGGYWPTTFPPAESNIDISPPRYSVSAN